jgi:hypothetical protein
MKEIKSRKINFKVLLFVLFIPFSLYFQENQDLLNIYTILIIFILIGMSFYEIRLNSQGIIRKNLMFPFLKTKIKWVELKYYVTVKEFNIDYFAKNYGNGNYYSVFERIINNSINKQEKVQDSLGHILKISNCIWFVDRDSKVCLRLDIKKYSNSKEILKLIKSNLSNYGKEFEVNRPSFPFFTFKKFNDLYFPLNSKELAILEKKITEPEKIKLNNLRKRKDKGDKVYAISRDLNLNMFFDKNE